MSRFYHGGVDPWQLTVVQLDMYLEAIVDIMGFESGEVDTMANTRKLRKNTGRLVAFDNALEECKQAMI